MDKDTIKTRLMQELENKDYIAAIALGGRPATDADMWQMIREYSILQQQRDMLLDRAAEVMEENEELKGFLRSAIDETHTEHYGDTATAYSYVRDILNEAEKLLKGEF